MSDVTMGVGEGGGKMFVKGDYDSIKHLQGKLLELEELRRLANTIASQADDNPKMMEGMIGAAIVNEAKRLRTDKK